MRRIWVHIGLPKTATTAIQLALYHLEDPHLRYARLLPALDHFEILMAASRGEGDAVARLDALLAEDDRDIVLSAEGLVQEPQIAQPLWELLQQRADRVTLLCTVRDPVDLVPSMMLHLLPENVPMFRGFINTRGRWLPYGYSNQFAALAQWLHRFGPDDLVLLDHDDPATVSPVTGFAAALGRPDLVLPDIRVNSSMTREGASVLSALIADTDLGPSPVLDLLWGTLLRGFGRTRFRLGDAALAAGLSEAGDDLALLEARLGRPVRRSGGDPPGAVTHPLELVIAGWSLIEPFADHLRQEWSWPVPPITTTHELRTFLGQVHAALTDPVAPQRIAVPRSFDPDRYLLINPDLSAARVDPVEHYRDFGFFEMRMR